VQPRRDPSATARLAQPPGRVGTTRRTSFGSLGPTASERDTIRIDQRGRDAADEREGELSRREREEGAIEGATDLRARWRRSARSSQRRTSARSSLWHDQRERGGRTRTEMNRSRSTASTGGARQARPPVLRDCPAREGLESAHRRVVEASRRSGVREARVRRGARERRRGGRGRTCSPSPVERARPAPSAPCTFLSSSKGAHESGSRRRESREVGRRGSLMRTRRGRSGAWARARGGVGGAQRCWRVVQAAGRSPSRVPSREGEWTSVKIDERRRTANYVLLLLHSGDLARAAR